MKFLKKSKQSFFFIKFPLVSLIFILFGIIDSCGENFDECFSQDYHFICNDPYAFLKEAGIDINQNTIRHEDLQLKKAKPTGHSKGGIYYDSDKEVYYLKKCKIFNEIVGSRLMNLLVGTQASPIVKAVQNKKKMVAVKKLKSFRMQREADTEGKKIVNEVKLQIAMDFLGLVDRHPRNLGYVRLNSKKLLAARVDYDTCFDFESTKHGYTSKTDHRSLKHLRSSIKKHPRDEIINAIREIVSIPDEKIVMCILESWTTLDHSGTKIKFQKCAELAKKLIERKKIFREALENPDSSIYKKLHKERRSKQKILQNQTPNQEPPRTPTSDEEALRELLRKVH